MVGAIELHMFVAVVPGSFVRSHIMSLEGIWIVLEMLLVVSADAGFWLFLGATIGAHWLQGG